MSRKDTKKHPFLLMAYQPCDKTPCPSTPAGGYICQQNGPSKVCVPQFRCGGQKSWYQDQNGFISCCDTQTGNNLQPPEGDNKPFGPYDADSKRYVTYNTSKETCTAGGILPPGLFKAADGTIGTHVCGNTAMDMTTGGSKNVGFNCCPTSQESMDIEGDTPPPTIYSYLPATYREGKDRQNADCTGNPKSPDQHYLLFDGQCEGPDPKACSAGGCNCTSCDEYTFGAIKGYYCHDPGSLPRTKPAANCKIFQDQHKLTVLGPGGTCKLKYTDTPWYQAIINYDSVEKHPGLVKPNKQCVWAPTAANNASVHPNPNPDAKNVGIITDKAFETLSDCQKALPPSEVIL